MITTKSLKLSWLFKTPLQTSIIATLVSLLFATIINFLFLTPSGLPLTLLITFVIAAPMSYLTVKVVVTMRLTIETQKMKLALEHARSEILAKFMRDAAHEFKTPLTLMSTNLYLLEKISDPEKKQFYTQNTYDQVEILNTLVETILILTRLDSTDKTAYQRESVHISQLVADIQSFNGSGRIKVLVEKADTLLLIQVNLSDLDLALKQIIDNALRFSPSETEITVQVAVSERQLSLQISDCGQGMSAETLSHIFDRFYRMDGSHTTRGLGLGLAIAKRVIELHNGHIEVQSELGKGSTVTAYLPVIKS